MLFMIRIFLRNKFCMLICYFMVCVSCQRLFRTFFSCAWCGEEHQKGHRKDFKNVQWDKIFHKKQQVTLKSSLLKFFVIFCIPSLHYELESDSVFMPIWKSYTLVCWIATLEILASMLNLCTWCEQTEK